MSRSYCHSATKDHFLLTIAGAGKTRQDVSDYGVKQGSHFVSGPTANDDFIVKSVQILLFFAQGRWQHRYDPEVGWNRLEGMRNSLAQGNRCKLRTTTVALLDVRPAKRAKFILKFPANDSPTETLVVLAGAENRLIFKSAFLVLPANRRGAPRSSGRPTTSYECLLRKQHEILPSPLAFVSS